MWRYSCIKNERNSYNKKREEISVRIIQCWDCPNYVHKLLHSFVKIVKKKKKVHSDHTLSYSIPSVFYFDPPLQSSSTMASDSLNSAFLTDGWFKIKSQVRILSIVLEFVSHMIQSFPKFEIVLLLR